MTNRWGRRARAVSGCGSTRSGRADGRRQTADYLEKAWTVSARAGGEPWRHLEGANSLQNTAPSTLPIPQQSPSGFRETSAALAFAMSFDLLAEFGSPAPSQQAQQKRPTQPQPNAASRPATTSFSLFDDLAGLSQPSTPSVTQGAPSNTFSTGFGSFTPQGASHSPAIGAPPTAAQAQSSNDDWGDFAGLSTPAQPAARINLNSSNTASQAPDPWASLRTSTGLGGTKAPSGISTSPAPQSGFNPPALKNDPFDLSAFGVPSRQQNNTTTQPTFSSQPAPSNPPAPRDPNVLFDAENLSEEDDDFGDFEDATPAFEQPAPLSSPFSPPVPVYNSTPSPALAPAPAPTPAAPVSSPPSRPAQPPKPAQKAAAPTTTPLNIDELLGELEVADPLTSVAPSSKQEDWKSSTTAKFASKSKAALRSTSGSAKTASKASAATSKPSSTSIGFDDDWDDLVPTTPAAKAASSTSIPGGFQMPMTTSISDPSPNALPPTNIPPPALLLTLFPPIFASVQASFFKPLGTQPTHVRSKILADINVVRFLRGYMTASIVAARVIAGRKLRWKRDKFLAQGMSIGQAGRAGAGGMKLTSIDRSESSKEDREAADVVRAWKEQVGRLRSVVVQVNAKDDRGRSLGSVPEIAEAMPIRTAKELEGGIAAPKPCALCGLKRDERIGKVDVDVEDSFGEWWVEQVSMHRACRNFWEEHKDKLRY